MEVIMNWKKIISFIGITFGCWALYRFTPLYDLITLEYVKQQSEQFKLLMDQHYAWVVVGYMSVFIATIAASIPSSIILTLLGGYLFGVIPAALYATTSVTIGVTIAYLVYRLLLKDALRERYADRAQRFELMMSEQGTSYLLVLHFSAVFPYFVINSLAALAGLSVWTVIWTTAVGFVPQGIIYAFAGKELGTIERVGDIFTPQVVVAFMLLIVLACIPILIRKYRQASLEL